MKKVILCFVFAFAASISLQAIDQYKTEIGTCKCGIDDYKCEEDCNDG